MARSVGFPTMKIGFSVGVSTLKIGGNPHWSFVFRLVRSTRPLCNHYGLLHGCNPAPFIGRISATCVLIGQPEFVWPSPFGVASPALLGDLDETKGAHLSQRGADGVSIHPVFSEMVERHGQAAVIVSAVVGKFDFDPGKDAMASKAQHLKGRALQHGDGASGELAGNPVFAEIILAHLTSAF
jgi:hypothetical protein